MASQRLFRILPGTLNLARNTRPISARSTTITTTLQSPFCACIPSSLEKRRRHLDPTGVSTSQRSRRRQEANRTRRGARITPLILYPRSTLDTPNEFAIYSGVLAPVPQNVG